MSMHDPNHPIWSLLRLVVRSIVLLVLLLATSTKFDNEVWVLIGYVLMDGGIVAQQAWKKLTRTGND